MRVKIHEFNTNFLEGTMTEKVPFYSGKSFMRIVISLFDKRKLISLRLIESRFHTVSFL